MGTPRRVINGDCDESCPTCYVGSTAVTGAPDGKDQDCNGVIDDTAVIYNIRLLENDPTPDCGAFCSSYGETCVNSGSNSNADNGLFTYAFYGCQPPQPFSGPCAHAIPEQHTGILCGGHLTMWTNCKCALTIYR